ncbi:MAG: LUD domain-containing protein [Verrucomicrobiales bacterium]
MLCREPARGEWLARCAQPPSWRNSCSPANSGAATAIRRCAHRASATGLPPPLRSRSNSTTTARYDDYQFGITRADGAIAETGTAILTDTHTADRLAALTPWVHVAVFHEADLCRTLGDAIACFGAERNIIFATGPSKTADIEGILIEGVHGPGEQICLCLV